VKNYSNTSPRFCSKINMAHPLSLIKNTQFLMFSFKLSEVLSPNAYQIADYGLCSVKSQILFSIQKRKVWALNPGPLRETPRNLLYH
jgi:hypothetical protein